jgi:hypothetical protein
MNTTERRLGLALLFTAGVIIINVYMVVTGTAGDFYDHLNGAAPQHAAQFPFKECINSHVPDSGDSMPIDSTGFLPGHVMKRG